MLRNQTWLDQTSTLGYNVAGTWNNLGYKNDPTTTTAAHVGNHRTRVIAGDAQAWPFKSTGFFSTLIGMSYVNKKNAHL